MKMLDDFRIALSGITANSPEPFMGASNAGHNVRTPNEAPKSNSRDEVLTVSDRNLFHWSFDACAIRDEIAILADCDPSSLGARSSVFTLGIDSIDIIKLSSRLKRRSINLSVSKIMHNATIEQMVQAIANDPKLVPDDLEKNHISDFVEQLLAYMRKSGYTMDNVEAVLPPTPLQEAIIADMSITESMRYFNQEVLLLEPLTDVNKLMLAFNTVVNESPILRTSFTSIDDPDVSASFAQVIHKAGTFHIRCIEIGPSDTSDNVIQKVMNQDKLMARNKVACMITFIVGERESHIVLSLSHALYDGWSLSLLHEDVLSAYHDQFTARPFYDKVLGHILYSSGNEALQYWSNYTSGIKICSFPARSKKASLQPQVHRLEKRSSISATSISAFTNNQGVSLQALGQTCWALVLASYLGTLDVVFGVVLSGRDSEESQQVMFPMMNTILVRSIIHGSVKHMLHDMQDGCAYATQFQHFPLRKAQAAAKQSHSRLFDSIFIFQREPPSSSTYRKLYKPVENRSSVEVSSLVFCIGHES